MRDSAGGPAADSCRDRGRCRTAVLVVVVLLQGLAGRHRLVVASRRDATPSSCSGWAWRWGRSARPAQRSVAAVLQACRVGMVPPVISWSRGWLVLGGSAGGSPLGSTPSTVERAVGVIVVGSLLGAVFIRGNLAPLSAGLDRRWTGYHTDMPFFEALAGSIAQLGPCDSVFHPGAQIRYHWLPTAGPGSSPRPPRAPSRSWS